MCGRMLDLTYSQTPTPPHRTPPFTKPHRSGLPEHVNVRTDAVPLLATYGLRLLHPLMPNVRWRGPMTPGRPTLYLTFDDGPSAFTPRLLRLLDRHAARATHFLIGARAARRPALVRALCAAGHTVGNHTYTHPDAWRTARHAVEAELRRATGLLEDLTQRPVRHVRPPYGHLTPAMMRWCRKNNQRLTMWDVMPGDFHPHATATHVLRWTERPLRDGSVVVLHDAEHLGPLLERALNELLPRLRDQGWRFAAL